MYFLAMLINVTVYVRNVVVVVDCEMSRLRSVRTRY